MNCGKMVATFAAVPVTFATITTAITMITIPSSPSVGASTPAIPDLVVADVSERILLWRRRWLNTIEPHGSLGHLALVEHQRMHSAAAELAAEQAWGAVALPRQAEPLPQTRHPASAHSDHQQQTAQPC